MFSRTCSQHDRRVAGVGAAGDGGDHHGTVLQEELLVVEGEGHRGGQLLGFQAESLEANLQQTSNQHQTVLKQFLDCY